MFKFIFYIFFFCIIIPSSQIKSNWESSVLGLLEKFDEEKLVNLPIISLWYGLSHNDNSLLYANENFTNTYNLAIEYGFLRVKKDKITEPYYLHFGERIYFENQSSHLKPKSWGLNGKTIDGWVFGLKAIDGYGIKSNGIGIEYQHSASLIWTRFDFEDYFKFIETNPQIQKFDQQYKFGRNYGCAASLQLFNKLQIGISYEQNFVYPEYDFGKWVVAYLTEIALQKWMEPLDEALRRTIGKNYWVYKHIYKTIVSLALTASMNKKPYLFTYSDRAFHNNSIVVKLSYIGY